MQAHHQDNRLRVIDMRDRRDYADAHIPGAVNLPVGAIVTTVNSIAFKFDEPGSLEEATRAKSP
ncbi:MAG: rhodanese-like domain-containing protein [Chloroflexota bacterium]